MRITEKEIDIGGKVEIVSTEIELLVNDMNKHHKIYSARLHLNIKIICEINGIEIEPMYTDRKFDLSKQDFNKLTEKGILKTRIKNIIQ